MDDPVAPDSPLLAAVDDDSASIPWHYIDASGETRGPVSFRVIRAQLRCAMLAPDAKVWREGLDEWCEARAFPAFASCVGDVNVRRGVTMTCSHVVLVWIARRFARRRASERAVLMRARARGRERTPHPARRAARGRRRRELAGVVRRGGADD